MSEVTLHGSELPYVLGIGIFAACLLFWCRTKLLLLYGVIEVIVGLSLMILASKVHGSFNSPFSDSFDTVRTTVTVTTFVGAVFGTIRGFDNICAAVAGLSGRN
jgi:hypothetical protein